MPLYHFFIDYRYIKSESLSVEEGVPMLGTLDKFQRAYATFQPQVFTILHEKENFAFSQSFWRIKVENGSTIYTHGATFKHEKGAINPHEPSYDDLLRTVQFFTLFSIYTDNLGHQVIGIHPREYVNGSALEAAVQYMRRNYNHPEDIPSLFELRPVAYQSIN